MEDRCKNRKNCIMIIVVACLLTVTAAVHASGEMKQAVPIEKDFPESTVFEGVNIVKKAMPPAPPGWIVAAETIDATSPNDVSRDAGYLRFTYTVAYKRLSGVQQEKKKLNDAFIDSSKKHNDEARPVIDELIKQQTDISIALKKSVKRKNRVEEDRLNDELDNHGRKMRALHDDIDSKIRLDVEPYLIKDAEASIAISVNDDAAEIRRGKSIIMPDATFAFRRDGERTGPITWKEGQTLILYGPWREEKDRVFTARSEHVPPNSKARTIKIIITGDNSRVEQLLGQTNLRSILTLLN